MEDLTESQLEQQSREVIKKLVTDFSFESNNFSEPIPWIDSVGLSRINKLLNGYASLFKIGIGNDQMQSPSSRKKLWISVNYGKEEMGGITYGSNGKQKISDPVDVDFRDEFSYDVTSEKYYHEGKETTAQDLFKDVVDVHTRPTKPFRGLWVRYRLWFWRKLLPALIKSLDISLVYILWLISGEKIKDDIFRRLMGTRPWGIKERETTPPINVEFEESKKMDFFGYKAKRWSVVFYCVFQLSLFVITYYYKIHLIWATKIFANNLLALSYVVVTFAVTEALIPQILKSVIIKITPAAFGSIAFKRLKI